MLITDVAANGAQVLVLGAVILHSAEAEGEVVGGECGYSTIGHLKWVLTPWAPKREVGYDKSQMQTKVENNRGVMGFIESVCWCDISTAGVAGEKGGQWLPLRTSESRQVLQHE